MRVLDMKSHTRKGSQTHRPVPGLNAALDRQIETFLSKLVPGKAWLRENAGYSGSPDRNQHPDRAHQPLDGTVSLDEVWVRLEYQMLMKLPLSRSLLFGIRVEVVPLRQVLESPQAAADLSRLLTTMSPAAVGYKGLTEARDAIVSHSQRTKVGLLSEPTIQPEETTCRRFSVDSQ